MNEVGYCLMTPFPPQGYVVLASLVVWPPPTPFPLLTTSPGKAYRLALYDFIAVWGRVSLVPDITFSTCRSPYTGEFFRAEPSSSHVPWPSPLRSRLGTPLPSFEVILTMRQDSLYVTACRFASHTCGLVFIGLQPANFSADCLLATGQLGLYPD